jgi:hypothetical protein
MWYTKYRLSEHTHKEMGMYTSEERAQIAKTIIAQMGGTGKLRAMVNGRQFLILDAGVQFTFSGKRGMNKCVVKLTPADTYDIEFWYINARKGTCDKKEEYLDVYEDMLIDLFEKTTGLYLSLGTMGR